MPLEDLIPGYADALAWEGEARELAFLDVAQTLCGVEVLPLTLRRLRSLLCAESPFFRGGVPGSGDVAAFLWALSPLYDARDTDARALFIAELTTLSTLEDLAAAVHAVGDFLDETFNDAPAAGPGGNAGGAPCTSFEATIIDAVAAIYHWSEDDILDCPLRRLYQYLRKITLRADPKAHFASRRSTGVKGDWLRSLNTVPTT